MVVVVGGDKRGYRRGRRISSRSDIKDMLISRNRLRRADIELYWRVNAERDEPARGGVIISTRWRGNKPERNRFRRRFREALRLFLPNLSSGVRVLLRLRSMGPAANAGKKRWGKNDSGDIVRELLNTAGLLSVTAQNNTKD